LWLHLYGDAEVTLTKGKFVYSAVTALSRPLRMPDVRPIKLCQLILLRAMRK